MNSLPNDWRTVKIQELTIRTKQRDPSKNPDKLFRYVDVSSVSNTLFKIENVTEMPGAEAPSRARKEIKAKDVLFATVRPTLKRIALVPQELDGEIASTGYCVLRPQPDKVVPEFLYHSLLVDSFVKTMGALERGASYPAIRDTDVYSASIPLPPLSEQRHIAYVLTTVQTAIEQQTKLIELTRELKSALMKKLFTEGLHGEKQKETEVGPVPESWQGTILGELAKPNGLIQTGPFGSQLHKSDYQNTGLPVVNPTHMLGNKINHENLPRISAETANKLGKYILKTGDIVFGRRGEIGRHGLVTKDEDGWFCGTGSFLVRVNKDHIDNRFLSYYFSLPQVVTWLNSHAAGVIMPNLNNTVLGIMPIFHPSYEDQVEIANALDSLEGKFELHKKKHQLLEELFRTLLHQLMTGQIRVKDLEI